MTVVRENPLPVGRYWLDLIGDEKRVRFEGGVKGLNTAHPGLVHVISTVHHDADEGSVGTPARDWVLFETTAPAIWDFEKIGSPTIADKSVTSEADTVQRPEREKDPLDALHDSLSDVGSLARGAFGVIIGITVAAGVVLLVSSRKRR